MGKVVKLVISFLVLSMPYFYLKNFCDEDKVNKISSRAKDSVCFSKSSELNSADSILIYEFKNRDIDVESSPLDTPLSFASKNYARFDLYNERTIQNLKNNHFEDYKLITRSMIDPDGDQKIEKDLIHAYLKKVFPDRASRGMLVIDWESRTFQTLKKRESTNSAFKAAEEVFISIVKTIKNIRPNLQVGIYGIPFRPTLKEANKQNIQWIDSFNTDTKWQTLLSHVDFLAPSFYIIYADEQIGHENNIIFLELQLKNALLYSATLNKPVYPFFWYRIASTPAVNSTYGRTIIPRQTIIKYLDFISSYRYMNRRISGLLWWDPREEIRIGYGSVQRDTSNENSIQYQGRDEIINEYAETLNQKFRFLRE